MNPRPKLAVATSAVILLALSACSANNLATIVGSEIAMKGDPEAGLLTLPNGRQYPILPQVLAYTGQGRFEYPDGRVQEGIWQVGKLEGVGKEISPEGTYTGQWHKGLRHGHGEYVTPDGERYVGEFADGQPQGKGTLTNHQGVYRGQFKNGQRAGEGHFKSHDGAIYEGLWVADQRSGVGEQVYANGAIYRGDWLSDRPHGFGEQQLVDGTVYQGQFVAGLRHGYGLHQIFEDLGYEGMWRQGQRHGYGVERLPDGSTYRGQWLAGKRSGHGREERLDGTFHDGEWDANLVMGHGIRKNSTGVIIAGAWLGDTISSGLLTLPDGSEYAGPLFSRLGQEVAASLLDWLQLQARENNAHAQLILASAYLDFARPEPAPEVARVWLQRSADAGVREAQYRLAVLLFEEDQQTAVQWLYEAAQQQHKQALERMGQLHQFGQFLPRNLQRAIDFYEHAISLGSSKASNNLAWLLATTQLQTLADPSRAIALIQPHVLYYQDWQHMDTYAAALARSGDFAAAVRVIDECLNLAAAEVDEITLRAIEARRGLYVRKQAFIEDETYGGS